MNDKKLQNNVLPNLRSVSTMSYDESDNNVNSKITVDCSLNSETDNCCDTNSEVVHDNSLLNINFVDENIESQSE